MKIKDLLLNIGIIVAFIISTSLLKNFIVNSAINIELTINALTKHTVIMPIFVFALSDVISFVAMKFKKNNEKKELDYYTLFKNKNTRIVLGLLASGMFLLYDWIDSM